MYKGANTSHLACWIGLWVGTGTVNQLCTTAEFKALMKIP